MKLKNFFTELGNGYTFVGNEYKISYGKRNYYIDILLFNYLLNSFVIVELKMRELRKEDKAQVEFYMNYVDNNLRKFYQDKTIGIIICKKENKFIMEYCSDDRIISKSYELM